MNVCTDQLVMQIARPERIVSLSFLSRDPQVSAMAAEAVVFPVNHGLAEEILPLRPDLVVAGSYTTRPTVHLLRRLGARKSTRLNSSLSCASRMPSSACKIKDQFSKLVHITHLLNMTTYITTPRRYVQMLTYIHN